MVRSPLSKKKGAKAEPEPEPEFFKVFIPKFSSDYLQIPPVFVQKFIQTLPENTTLRDGSGKCWNVGLVMVDKKLYFGSGWKEFAKEHSLERGDFLLFKYYRDSLFSVSIFGTNGCKKQGVAFPLSHEPVKIEEEDTHTGPSHAYKQTQNEKSGLNGSTKRPGSLEGSQANRRVVTDLKEQGAPRPANYTAPNNPHFMSTITIAKSHKTRVYIPRGFRTEVHLKRHVTLRDQKNKLWPVKIKFYEDGRAFLTNGWSSFLTDNNIQVNDNCIFESVVGKGKICKQIKVRVIR